MKTYTDKTGKFASGNPGRPKGATNKAARELREQLADIVAGEIAALPQLLADMMPGERVALLSRLLPYVMPRLHNVELNAEMRSAGPGMDLRDLSDAELEALIQANGGRAAG